MALILTELKIELVNIENEHLTNLINKADDIIDAKSEVFGVIYRIICITTNKMYYGQTVSHRLQHKRFRPFGAIGRFKDHCSEVTNNTKKKQCMFLNNAIRKYGIDKFKVETMLYCLIHDLDHYETWFIEHFKSLYPHGYNLTIGGKTASTKNVTNEGELKEFKKQGSWNLGTTYSEERKEKISIGIKNYIDLHPEYREQITKHRIQYFYDDKIDKFSKVLDKLDENNIKKHIYKAGKTAYTIKIGDVVSCFSGKDLSVTYQRVIEFLNNLVLLKSKNNKECLEKATANPQPKS